MEEDALVKYHKRVNKPSNSWKGLEEQVTVEGKLTYKCKQCKALFSHLYKFIFHALIHTGDKAYICRVPGCTKTYLRRHALNYHLKLAHCEEPKFVCTICDIAFKSPHMFYSHRRRIHAAPNAFKCKYCSAKFKGIPEVTKHESLHKPNNEVLITCELCDNVYLNSSLLINHLKDEHGVSVLYCAEEEHDGNT